MEGIQVGVFHFLEIPYSLNSEEETYKIGENVVVLLLDKDGFLQRAEEEPHSEAALQVYDYIERPGIDYPRIRKVEISVSGPREYGQGTPNKQKEAKGLPDRFQVLFL